MSNEENFLPESHIELAMVKEVMKEFTWPLTYEVLEGIDDDRVNLKFPTCEIELFDVPEDGITIIFSSYDGGKELDARAYEMIDFIDDYDPEKDFEPDYSTSLNPVDQTRSNVKSAIKWLQQYHLGFITGEDYGWVERYLNHN